MKQPAAPKNLTFWLLLAAAYVKYGECLRCYTCNGEQDCSDPREEQCPKNNECFTVAENYDVKRNGLRKGCAPTCDRVNIMGKLCRTCRSELCNAKTGLGRAFEKPSALPPRGPFGPRSASESKRTYVFLLHSLLFLLCTIHCFQFSL